MEDTLSSQSSKIPATKRHIKSYNNLNIISSQSLPPNLAPVSLNKRWENVAFYYENHRLDEAYNEVVQAQQEMSINPK